MCYFVHVKFDLSHLHQFVLNNAKTVVVGVYGQIACSTFSDESSCNIGDGTGYCTWDSSNSLCSCDNPMNQDIIFLIETSDNYLSNDDFKSILTFASNILYHGSPLGTRVGLATYSLTTREIISLNDNVDAQSAVSYVMAQNNSEYSGMPNVENAVSWSIDEFNSYSSRNTRKTLFTIMAGISINSPCTRSIDVKKENIDSYVIAVGTGWEKRAYRCFGVSDNNYEGLITIDKTINLPNSTQQHIAELLSCPHNPLIKITEIRPQGTAPSDRFFEFYNKGEDIDAKDIYFQGLFYGSLDFNYTIAQGSINVIYSSADSSNRLPNCTYCSCNLDTTYIEIDQCDDANYFGCGAPSSSAAGDYEPYTTDNCAGDDSSFAIDNFNLSIWDASTDKLLDWVYFDMDEYWTPVQSGYTYELKYFGYNNGFGSSWGPSCSKQGTPGDIPQDCIKMVGGCNGYDNFCTVGGDLGAECNSNDECICSDYWYNYNNITCQPFPTPENCTGLFDTNLNLYVVDQPNWDGLYRYKATWCESRGVPTSINNCTFDNPQYDYGLPVWVTSVGPSTEGWNVFSTQIQLINDDNTENSQTTNCTVDTSSPSMAPTQQPTYVAGRVPYCEYTLAQDLRSFELTWQPVNSSTNSPPDNFLDGYQWIRTDDTNVDIGRCCNYTATLFSDFEVGVDTVRVSPDYEDDSGLDYDDELSVATTCVQFTQAPTPGPTNYPSILPSDMPTLNPSIQPTAAPTYATLQVPGCYVNITAGSMDKITINWDIPTFNYPFTVNETQIHYSLFVGDDADPYARYDYTDVPPQTYQFVSVPDWDVDISIQIEVSTDIDPNGSNYPKTICTKSSTAPTAAPVKPPTMNPVFPPTAIPTAPSIDPTSIPSVAPTTPTIAPTNMPTPPSNSPTSTPSFNPTVAPTDMPSIRMEPTSAPTDASGLENSNCNYGVWSSSLWPYLEGYCSRGLFSAGDVYGSLMPKCSDDGESAVINFYSDTLCNNYTGNIDALGFECGYSSSDCQQAILVEVGNYIGEFDNCSDISGDPTSIDTVYIASVDGACTDFPSSGFSISLTTDLDGLYYELILAPGCNGTLAAFGTLLDGDCEYLSSDDNTTSLTFEAFDTDYSTSTTEDPHSSTTETNLNNCNYAVLESSLWPYLDGYCSRGLYSAAGDIYNSIKPQCSKDGNNSIVHVYSDDSCTNYTFSLDAFAFECGYSSNGCTEAIFVEVENYIGEFDNCSDITSGKTTDPDPVSIEKAFIASVDDACIDYPSSGFSISITTDVNGLYYELILAPGCNINGTLAASGTLYDGYCEYFSGNDMTLSWFYYAFDINYSNKYISSTTEDPSVMPTEKPSQQNPQETDEPVTTEDATEKPIEPEATNKSEGNFNNVLVCVKFCVFIVFMEIVTL